MKKLIALLLAMALLPTLAIAAGEFDVTEPITITWWHAHEDQLSEYLNYMVDKFNNENGMGITVDPVYIGNYSELNTQFIAAAAAGSGTVPALVTSNTSYPASYGAEGLCEVLDPYIDAYDYDIEDFGEGLIASTSYDGEQICLPYLISTQVMYYNKNMAEEEGIEMPKTIADMDAFLEKATVFNEDGTTKRYGTVFGGWDYWYYEMLYAVNRLQADIILKKEYFFFIQTPKKQSDIVFANFLAVAAGLLLQIVFILAALLASSLIWATGKVDFDVTANMIREIGPENCIISTDLGQQKAIYPDEGMAEFARRLKEEKDFTNEEIRTMIVHNPRRLLDKE
jgi:maltose-binding protein MalE